MIKTVSESNWSETEKQAAHEVFKKAYEREISTLVEIFKQEANKINEVDDLWRLHDFLSAKRHDIDGKYDYRYDVLLFVFADLLKDGWLTVEELQFLASDKLAKIIALSRIQ